MNLTQLSKTLILAGPLSAGIAAAHIDPCKTTLALTAAQKKQILSDIDEIKNDIKVNGETQAFQHISDHIAQFDTKSECVCIINRHGKWIASVFPQLTGKNFYKMDPKLAAHFYRTATKGGGWISGFRWMDIKTHKAVCKTAYVTGLLPSSSGESFYIGAGMSQQK